MTDPDTIPADCTLRPCESAALALGGAAARSLSEQTIRIASRVVAVAACRSCPTGREHTEVLA